MYSNNIVNFQESTTILNACSKTSGNLLNAPVDGGRFCLDVLGDLTGLFCRKCDFLFNISLIYLIPTLSMVLNAVTI